MKLCIFCKHWIFTSGNRSYYADDYFWFSTGCERWNLNGYDINEIDIRNKVLEEAKDCDEYEEEK